MNETKLKLCPLCEGSASTKLNTYANTVTAYCTECQCRVTGKTVEDAAEKWNCRPQPDNIPLTLEELRGMAFREWVWIERLGAPSESAYYRKHADYGSYDGCVPKEEIRCGYPGMTIIFHFTNYGKTWLAYRHKPTQKENEDGMDIG